MKHCLLCSLLILLLAMQISAFNCFSHVNAYKISFSVSLPPRPPHHSFEMHKKHHHRTYHIILGLNSHNICNSYRATSLKSHNFYAMEDDIDGTVDVSNWQYYLLIIAA